MKLSTRIGITAGAVALGLAAFLSVPNEISVSNKKTLKELSQTPQENSQINPIITKPYSEPLEDKVQQEEYIGPKSLQDFLNNSQYGFDNPQKFFASSERQLNDFRKVQEDIINWARQENYTAKVSDDQKKLQQKGWPTGVLSLDLGSGIKYEARLLNNNITTKINTPTIFYNFTSDLRTNPNSSNKDNPPNFYHIKITDKKRLDDLSNNTELSGNWYELSFSYDGRNKNESQIPIDALKGAWAPDPRVKDLKKQRAIFSSYDSGISIPEGRFSNIKRKSNDLNNLFKEKFPNTTKYLKK
tara:strand:+ start:1650 stop:2549 length:900 start_codon:yes stop_codon:yes gene_type:complete